VVGAPPPSIPVDVEAHDLDTGHSLAVDSDVADETGVGDPIGDLLDMVAPTAVAQAATQIYDGPPANESGSMCLRIDVRGSSQPLGFCDRYVSTGAPGDDGEVPPALALATSGDMTSALSLLDSAQFAALDVTRVTANIDAQRGLIEGAIVEARAPARAVAGGLLPVHLLVRRYQGPLQSISFHLRIPRGLHGQVLVELKGASSGGAGSAAALASALASALGGGSGSGSGGSVGSGTSGSGPASMAALRSQVAAIPKYDGLTASFIAATGGHPGPALHAYRDPALLITGKTSLFVVVAGRRR
jgi:hypothetical protein